MAEFHSIPEVNIFYEMIEGDMHTLASGMLYGSSSNKQQEYVPVKKRIGPSRYIRT